MCIENTSQISNTIGVTLKINETMGKINALMETEQQANQQKPNSEELLRDIGESLGNVKQDYDEYCKKLEKRPKL